jgi:hypothetical protein
LAHGAASIKDPLRAEYGSALSFDDGLLWVPTPRRIEQEVEMFIKKHHPELICL